MKPLGRNGVRRGSRQYPKNPLRMNKKTTDEHPNHKRKVVACKKCTNEKLRQNQKPLLCPNCGYHTLHVTEKHEPCDLYTDPDNWHQIACSACFIHWTVDHYV